MPSKTEIGPTRRGILQSMLAMATAAAAPTLVAMSRAVERVRYIEVKANGAARTIGLAEESTWGTAVSRTNWRRRG